MGIDQTLVKLKDMKLKEFAEALEKQQSNKEYSELTFEERLALLVDIEWSAKKNRRLEGLIKKSSFRYSQACVEGIEYYPDRKLDKSFILKLATNQYIYDNRNVVIKGPTGAGKTYIANALGISACRSFIPVKYVRLPDLLDELAIARETGIFRKVINQYKKIRLLILDEFLLNEIKESQSNDLMELIESRCESRSTIFCSQHDYDGWYEKLGEGTLADAILDRIIHSSYDLFIDSEVSMRERHGIEKE